MIDYAEITLTIPKGCHYEFQLEQGEGNLVYRQVTAIAKSAPVKLTVPAHGLPGGWTVKALGTDNASPLLLLGEQLITVIDADTLELNGVQSLNWPDYAGGVVLAAHKPLSFAGKTARLEVKAKAEDAALLFPALTSGNGLIITEGRVGVVMTEAQTAFLPVSGAVYRLTLANSGSTEDELLQFGTIDVLPW